MLDRCPIVDHLATSAPPRLTRRRLLRQLAVASVAIPFGPGALADTGLVEARAWPVTEDGSDDEGEAPPAASGQIAPGVFSFSLQTGDGPLERSRSFSQYKAEIGFSTFEDDGDVMHMHPWKEGLRENDWMSRRIGQFSFRDGAVMVDVLAELYPTFCVAIEMRRQAYRDHRYIRGNWLMVDSHSGHGEVKIGTNGIWNEMRTVAEVEHAPAVQGSGNWNTLLFMADGDHLEGWVNGEKVVEGTDPKWGSGRIGLVTMREDKQPFRARFRNLRVWENALPDPASVW